MRKTRWWAAAFCALAAPAALAMENEDTPLFTPWERTVTLTAGAGYKSNVTLARDNPQSSPFAQTGLEALLMRLPVDGNQFTFYLVGEDTRYWSAGEVDHENLLIGQVEARRFWANDWQAALGLEGFYVDQVIDFSITDTNREALPVRGGAVTARPGARRELSENVWLSIELPGTRQWYNGLVDDYWELGPRISIGRTYGNRSEISAGYSFTHRGYDDAPARNENGGILTNTVRSAAQHDIFCAWKHHWDKERRWRSTTKAGYRHNKDNASGYFDYKRYEISHQLRFQAGQWELSAEAKLTSYRFPIQTVSDDDLRHRRRTDLRVTLRAERQLTRRLGLYAQFEHEGTRSNDPLDEYQGNTVGGGMNFEF